MSCSSGAFVIYGAEIKPELFDESLIAHAWIGTGYESFAAWLEDECILPRDADREEGDISDLSVQCSCGGGDSPQFVVTARALPSAHLDALRGPAVGVARFAPVKEEDRKAAEKKIRAALKADGYSGRLKFGWYLICYALA